MKTEYTADDLSYEELVVNKQTLLDSSHWQVIYRLLKLKLKVYFSYGKRIYC